MTQQRTKRRKKPTDRLSDMDRLKVVHKYMTSDCSSSQLAEEFNTSPKNIDLIVQRHWTTLSNIRETKILTASTNVVDNHKSSAYMALKAIGRVPQINKEFLDKLSGPDDPLLTDNELQYCYNLIATGDNLKALEAADLHRGLMTAKSDKNRNQYRLACSLRGHYLRQKKNVAEYIIKLKEEQYIPEAVDKQFIQRELLETLHHQKEGGEPTDKRLRTVELLGKTVGAFSDVIKVEEVDPAKALDYIDSLAKADDSVCTDVIEYSEESTD